MFLEPFPLFLPLFEHLLWYPPSYHWSSLSSLFTANYTFPVSGGFFVLLSSFLLPLPLLCLFSRSFSPQLISSLSSSSSSCLLCPSHPCVPAEEQSVSRLFLCAWSNHVTARFLSWNMVLSSTMERPCKTLQHGARDSKLLSLPARVCVRACVWAWVRASVSVQYDRWLPVCAWAFFWWDLSLFVIWQGRKPPISLFSCECMCVCLDLHSLCSFLLFWFL